MDVSQWCVTWLVANLMHILVNQNFQFTSVCFHFSAHVFSAVEVEMKSLVQLPTQNYSCTMNHDMMEFGVCCIFLNLNYAMFIRITST